MLREKMVPEQLQEQLMAKTAPGIVFQNVVDIPLSAPALQTITESARYRVTFLDPVDTAVVQERIDALNESLKEAERQSKLAAAKVAKAEEDKRLVGSVGVTISVLANGAILIGIDYVSRR